MSTYKSAVATNICGTLPPCTSFVSPPDAALVCTAIGDPLQGGFPISGGRLQIQFWSSACPPSTNPSLNICFNSSIQLAWCAAEPDEGKEYNPREFITQYGYFSSRSSEQLTSAQFRWNAKLTVPDQTHITTQINISFLDQVNGVNTWVPYYNFTTNLDLQGPYVKNEGLAYKSNPEYLPITPSLPGPNCQVSYVSVIAGLQPLRYACGTSQGDVETCGMWNGDYYLTCFRGEVIYTDDSALPVPFLMALNSSNCSSTSSCGCDKCEVKSNFPGFDCLFNSDPFFKNYVLTNYNEPINVSQQMQIAQGAPFPIMVKFFNNTLYFYWCPTGNTANWIRSTGTVVQNYGPSIWTVQDGNIKIVFYATKYPSPELLPDCTLVVAEVAPIILAEKPPLNDAEKIIQRHKNLQSRANGGCGCGGKAKHNWHAEKKTES